VNPNDVTLVREKHAQLDAWLPALEADAWLVLTREDSDPAVHLLTGDGVVGEAAFLMTREGRKVAVVADYDVDPFERTGVFEVVSYGAGGFMEPLRALLEDVAPTTVAVNASTADPLADGLSVGMLHKLGAILPVEPFDARLRPAPTALADLRALKTPEELRRLREAVRITETVLEEVGDFLRAGRTEREVAAFVKERHRHYGVTHSFGDGANVMVGHVGMGHRPASDAELTPGDTVVVDMGVYVEGYTSDIQRAWYVRRDGETAAPPEIEHRFRTGHDAYTPALGHQIGRAVHDGGTTLAPLNARYGERGKPAIRAGEVYTVEPVVHGRTGVDGPPVGHEQDVLVTEDGHEVLSHPPTRFPLV
jgi:Xaa-Pro aminopeptidase